MTGHPVTLATGEAVDSWDPLWRDECLKRHVKVLELLRINGLEARRQRLADIGAEHGPVFLERVKAGFLEAFKEQQAAKAAQERQEAMHG